jgi:hypothetical protein
MELGRACRTAGKRSKMAGSLKMSHYPSFPLLASDQAEVVRIFLELMSEGDRAERASNFNTNQPVGPHNDPSDLLPPGDPSDLA